MAERPEKMFGAVNVIWHNPMSFNYNNKDGRLEMNDLHDHNAIRGEMI